jgi:hypothetical protein
MPEDHSAKAMVEHQLAEAYSADAQPTAIFTP